MIMLARPLLADADWPNKAFAGKVKDICPCIGDQEGCINEFVEGGHIQCSVNPRTGYEDVLSRDLPQSASPKNVAVMGRPCRYPRCHRCRPSRPQSDHFRKEPIASGWHARPGSQPKIKYEVKNYLAYLEHQLEICSQKYGLKVELNSTVAPESLKGKFDAIIIGIGGVPVAPKLPGIDQPNVIQAR